MNYWVAAKRPFFFFQPTLRKRPPQMKKLRCPRKREGEWAEVCFWARALWYGLIVSRPYGESSPYDFLVHNGRRIFRVQVRTTSKLAAATNMYRIHARDSVGHTFTSGEIDFIVALVVFRDSHRRAGTTEWFRPAGLGSPAPGRTSRAQLGW